MDELFLLLLILLWSFFVFFFLWELGLVLKCWDWECCGGVVGGGGGGIMIEDVDGWLGVNGGVVVCGLFVC